MDSKIISAIFAEVKQKQKVMTVTVETPLNQIAQVIRKDWKKPYFGAVPYLDAMSTLSSVNEDYFMDSGKSIVLYFLSNATTWRGETAREVKKVLNKLAK